MHQRNDKSGGVAYPFAYTVAENESLDSGSSTGRKDREKSILVALRLLLVDG